VSIVVSGISGGLKAGDTLGIPAFSGHTKIHHP